MRTVPAGEVDSTAASPSTALVVSLAAPPPTAPTGLRRWLQFWRPRRTEQRDDLSQLSQLSVAALRAELLSLEDELAAKLQTLADFQEGEREALAHRDRAALDAAWQRRETEEARVQELERRSKVVREALALRMDPAVEAWRERCDEAVASWRKTDEEQVAEVEQALRRIESIVWNLFTREVRRHQQRESLLADFQALEDAAKPVKVTCPEIDWSVPPIALRDVTTRLESTLEMLGRSDVQQRLGVGEAG
jgi:hypothetical protein